MRTFTFNVTDLMSVESPSLEITLDETDVQHFTETLATDLIDALRGQDLKGLCVALYDETGDPVSIVPLDTVQ
jgi:hypothetical protein